VQSSHCSIFSIFSSRGGGGLTGKEAQSARQVQRHFSYIVCKAHQKRQRDVCLAWLRVVGGYWCGSFACVIRREGRVRCCGLARSLVGELIPAPPTCLVFSSVHTTSTEHTMSLPEWTGEDSHLFEDSFDSLGPSIDPYTYMILAPQPHYRTPRRYLG
jgi:hypothetical protein